MGDSRISGAWTHTNASSTSAVWSLRRLCYVCPATLGPSAPGPPGYDRYGHFDSFLGQQTRRDTLSHLFTFNSLLWLEVQSAIVRARLFLGCLNVIADHLSRPLSRPKQPIPTEWSLHPEIERHICRVWGTLEIDMYATVSNSLLPRLMSPIPDPRAIAVDALSQVWQGRSMLVNVHVSPHSPCSTEFFRRSQSDGRDDSHSPWWPNQLCLPHLLRLCVEHPLFFPTVKIFCLNRTRSTSQTKCRTICTHGGSHATLLGSRVFQTRSLGSQQLLGGPQPIACRTIGGFASFDGCRARF